MAIKICGLTRAEDAVLAESLGADYCGFIFVKHSPRYRRPEEIKPIIQQLSTAKAVGVFCDSNFEEIDQIAQEIGLYAVQSYAPVTQALQHAKVIQAVKIEQTMPSDAFQNPYAEYYLCDTAKAGQWGGLGLQFDWSLLPADRSRLFLAGGIGIDNVETALAQNTYAIDLCSSVEVSPGIKDPQILKAFFDEVTHYDR